MYNARGYACKMTKKTLHQMCVLHISIILMGLNFSIISLAQLPSLDNLTENSAPTWGVSSDTGTITIINDSIRFHDGSASLHIDTDSGSDTWAWAPLSKDAAWDISNSALLRFWVYAENPSVFNFQFHSIRLATSDNDYFVLTPTAIPLNNAIDQWYEVLMPITGDANWQVTTIGSPNLNNINYLEVHTDTWDFGFDLWFDGMGFITNTSIAFDPLFIQMYQDWRFTPWVVASNELGSIPVTSPELDNWTSSVPSIATVGQNGLITAISPGFTTVNTELNGFVTSLVVQVVSPVTPPIEEVIPMDLSTPMADFVWEMPVIVIRFLPTTDGVNLDTSVSPGFFDLEPISLTDLTSNIDSFDGSTKFMLEEGSRFRGYNSTQARPSLGYKVVKYFTVFEPTPPAEFLKLDDGDKPIYKTDYNLIFQQLGVEDLVNNLGAREIWIWHGTFDSTFPSYDAMIHNPINARWMPESNMSSATTGDISNSFRDPNDLPIYNHTYTVYGQNFRRTQAEVVHNHGHQLEAILNHTAINQDGSTKLFWQDFVGFNSMGEMTLGRAGWTHMPPNTLIDYDYVNTTIVNSDIEDWRPDNSGISKALNQDTWANLIYDWPNGANNIPQKTESQWYIYWMQNMPGLNNQIPGAPLEFMTNWWHLTARWDNIALGIGLHESDVIFQNGFD